MLIKRREAITLATGIVIASAVGDAATACGKRPDPAFNSSQSDRNRMLGKLDAFRQHWNAGKLEQFLSTHCTKYVQVNFTIDGRGGNWKDPLEIARLHERYPKIISDFSGVMFDPMMPCIYSMAEFSMIPKPPRSEKEEILLCGGRPGSVPVLAIYMRFKEKIGGKKNTLSDGHNIVEHLSLRENHVLSRCFE